MTAVQLIYSKGLGLSHTLKGPKSLINWVFSQLWTVSFLYNSVFGNKWVSKLLQKLLHVRMLSAQTLYHYWFNITDTKVHKESLNSWKE